MILNREYDNLYDALVKARREAELYSNKEMRGLITLLLEFYGQSLESDFYEFFFEAVRQYNDQRED